MRTLRVFNDRSSLSDQIRLDALEQGQNFLNQKVHNIEAQINHLTIATRDLEETENKHFLEMQTTLEDYKGDINKLRRQMKAGCINDWRTKAIAAFLLIWLAYLMFTIPPHLVVSVARPSDDPP
jgi:hypothetical protein